MRHRPARGAGSKTLLFAAPSLAALGDPPTGGRLFGLSGGSTLLGNGGNARLYFDRLTKDAPSSGQAPKAAAFLATGVMPKGQGLGCVGCHK